MPAASASSPQMKNRKSHDIVAMGLADPAQPRPSRRRRRRPACRRRLRHAGADPARLLRRRKPSGSASRCRSPANTASASCSCRAIRRAGAIVEEIVAEVVRRRGPGAARLARRADRSVAARRERPAERAGLPAGVHRPRPEGIADQTLFERRLFILRKVISGVVYELARPAGQRLLSGVDVVAHGRLQGPAARDPARRLLPGPAATRAVHVGARARAPALLDQHLPVLVAGPSLPDGRAQRRDQHAARQRELDGGAPGLRRVASCSARTSPSCGRSPTRASPTPPASTTRSNSWSQGGYSLSHAMMMLIPEAWAGNPLMDESRRAFYEYHAALMEPWDGPAAVAFTDGRQIGATLDRNGLRPARYLVTDDDLVVLASEMRRAADPGIEDRHQVAPAARQDAARRPRAGPHHLGRRDEDADRRPRIPIASGSSARRSCSRSCSPSRRARPAPTCRCSISSRPSATRRRT